jgi:hypothetical protein
MQNKMREDTAGGREKHRSPTAGGCQQTTVVHAVHGVSVKATCYIESTSYICSLILYKTFWRAKCCQQYGIDLLTPFTNIKRFRNVKVTFAISFQKYFTLENREVAFLQKEKG